MNMFFCICIWFNESKWCLLVFQIPHPFTCLWKSTNDCIILRSFYVPRWITEMLLLTSLNMFNFHNSGLARRMKYDLKDFEDWGFNGIWGVHLTTIFWKGIYIDIYFFVVAFSFIMFFFFLFLTIFFLPFFNAALSAVNADEGHFKEKLFMVMFFCPLINNIEGACAYSWVCASDCLCTYIKVKYVTFFFFWQTMEHFDCQFRYW